MPRLPSHSHNKKIKQQHPDEEVASLLLSNAVAGHASSTSARWQRIVLVVLAACLALFVWETIEVDQKTGDVQLKLHSGSKQNDVDVGDDDATPGETTARGTGESTSIYKSIYTYIYIVFVYI